MLSHESGRDIPGIGKHSNLTSDEVSNNKHSRVSLIFLLGLIELFAGISRLYGRFFFKNHFNCFGF